jgi:hypothetical protein
LDPTNLSGLGEAGNTLQKGFYHPGEDQVLLPLPPHHENPSTLFITYSKYRRWRSYFREEDQILLEKRVRGRDVVRGRDIGSEAT